jgi:hypothetical protein
LPSVSVLAFVACVWHCQFFINDAATFQDDPAALSAARERLGTALHRRSLLRWFREKASALVHFPAGANGLGSAAMEVALRGNRGVVRLDHGNGFKMPDVAVAEYALDQAMVRDIDDVVEEILTDPCCNSVFSV